MPALLFQTAVDTPLDIPLVSQMFSPVCALQEKVLALGIFKKKLSSAPGSTQPQGRTGGTGPVHAL